MSKVLNKHRDGLPAGAVYIGRGSKWGNPFRIGVDGDRATVIARYEAWLRSERELLRSLDERAEPEIVCTSARRSLVMATCCCVSPTPDVRSASHGGGAEASQRLAKPHTAACGTRRGSRTRKQTTIRLRNCRRIHA